MTTPLRALALVCSLKPSPADSSTHLIASQVLQALAEHDVSGEVVRVVDHDVRPGVEKDMGDGDAWPAIREKLVAAPLIAAFLVLGFLPNLALNVINPAVDKTLSHVQQAIPNLNPAGTVAEGSSK